jgi:hypothetical protein
MSSFNLPAALLEAALGRGPLKCGQATKAGGKLLGQRFRLAANFASAGSKSSI